MLHSSSAALDCPLTMEAMRDAVIAPCGHTFDRDAIVAWVRLNGTCPLCRSPMLVDGLLVPNLVVRQILAVPAKEEIAVECKCIGSCVGSEVSVSSGVSRVLPESSESEYEEVEEVIYVPEAPESPTVDDQYNPFAEFTEDSFAGGLLRPRKPRSPLQRAVTTRRRVRREKCRRMSPTNTKRTEEVSDGVSTLKMEITIHNLSPDAALPSSQVMIPETVLTWRGVSQIPEIGAQQTVKAVLHIKLKANVEPTQSTANLYSVVYRGVTSEFSMGISAFTHRLQRARPVTTGLSCFNILLFGVAGCGKSSFVNKWASMMEPSSFPTMSLAPSGGGEKHITKRLVAYPMPSSRITLWDTWGWNGNYRDDTLPYIFEGRLPSNWKMGDLKTSIIDAEEGLRAGEPTAFQRRIHCAILMISIDDLEDPYQCRLISDRFQLFKEFSPILVINKVDKPFLGHSSDVSRMGWIRPWVPPAVTAAMTSVASLSANAATAAAAWASSAASRAHAGYLERGWAGVIQRDVLVSTAAAPSDEDSRLRLSVEDPQEFELISPYHDTSPTSLPFWAEMGNPIVQRIKRVASERCFVSPNSIFLNVNYVEHGERCFLMDMQTLQIAEEALRRAILFETRYGSPEAKLPHEVSVNSKTPSDDWKW